jgi:hypothetical protein
MFPSGAPGGPSFLHERMPISKGLQEFNSIENLSASEFDKLFNEFNRVDVGQKKEIVQEMLFQASTKENPKLTNLLKLYNALNDSQQREVQSDLAKKYMKGSNGLKIQQFLTKFEADYKTSKLPKEPGQIERKEGAAKAPEMERKVAAEEVDPDVQMDMIVIDLKRYISDTAKAKSGLKSDPYTVLNPFSEAEEVVIKLLLNGQQEEAEKFGKEHLADLIEKYNHEQLVLAASDFTLRYDTNQKVRGDLFPYVEAALFQIAREKLFPEEGGKIQKFVDDIAKLPLKQVSKLLKSTSPDSLEKRLTGPIRIDKSVTKFFVPYALKPAIFLALAKSVAERTGNLDYAEGEKVTQTFVGMFHEEVTDPRVKLLIIKQLLLADCRGYKGGAFMPTRMSHIVAQLLKGSSEEFSKSCLKTCINALRRQGGSDYIDKTLEPSLKTFKVSVD